MNLRQARVDDTWRRVFARGYASKLKQVSFQALQSLRDSEIHFRAGITAIVGANGVGKSTLLAAIADLLANGEGENDSNHRIRLRGSRLAATVEHQGENLTLGLQDGAGDCREVTGRPFTGEYQWLDPSSLAGRYITQINTDRNFADLLESVTPQYLNADELAIANYLVGKFYGDVSIYEILDYAGFERFPYFRATAAGITYGSEGMGRGELSLLLTYWTLRDIPPNSILVLEEPETHVSPKSQDCLINIVAKFSLEKGIWTIVTTHSPTIIRHIPAEHVRLLARGTGLADIHENIAKTDIALLLGGGVKLTGAFLVEDQAAKDFLTALLDEKAPALVKQYEIVSANSAPRISVILENMPNTGDWLTLIGVYDGDLRADITGAGFKWPFKFLPGTKAPEELLVAHLQAAGNTADLLAAELHKTPAQLTVALDHAAGVDPHDFFTELAKALHVHVSAIRAAGVRIWLQNTDNATAAQTLVSELQTAINGQ
jgi:predicted ATPase